MHVWTLDLAIGPNQSYNGKLKSKLATLQNSSIMWQFEIIGTKWIRLSYEVFESLGL
jgi:hypothetical protein